MEEWAKCARSLEYGLLVDRQVFLRPELQLPILSDEEKGSPLFTHFAGVEFSTRRPKGTNKLDGGMMRFDNHLS